MVDEPAKTVQDLVRTLKRYPEDAFLFVREGLGFASQSIHGPENEAHRLLQHYLAKNELDWDDLAAQYHSGQLPEPVVEAVDAAGGLDKLNRHVSGRELCWGLRDYALDRWGSLAGLVLEQWNIRGTADFGRIVFGFIEFDMMRKQNDDRLEDFVDVYDFSEAFDKPFPNTSPNQDDPKLT